MMHPASLRTHHRYQVGSLLLAFAGMVLLAACLVVLPHCTSQQGDKAMKILSMTPEACVRVAVAFGRKDIATYCDISESAVEILTTALSDQTCTLPEPDAGHD